MSPKDAQSNGNNSKNKQIYIIMMQSCIRLIDIIHTLELESQSSGAGSYFTCCYSDQCELNHDSVCVH